MFKVKNKIANTVIILLFLLPYIYLPNYVLKGTPQKIFKTYSMIIYIFTILVYMKKNKFKLPSITILVAIMHLIPLVSTFLNDKSQMEMAFKMFIGTISLSLLIDYNISNREENFLKSVMILFGTLVLINISSFYIYYPSMDPRQLYFYFLGNDNGSIYETFLFTYIAIIYFLTYKKKIPTYFYAILIYIFLGYFYVHSGNGMVCMLVTILFSIFYDLNVINKITNPIGFLIVYIFFFLNIVVYRTNNIFVNFVLKKLEKSSTFSGRTFLWDKSFIYIKKHPLIGNGFESVAKSTLKIGKNKTHNMILQYLYNGGYLMIGLMIIILYKLMKRIKESTLDINVKKCMKFSIFLFLVISLFDFYINKFTFIMIIMIYYVMCSNNKESKNV